MRIVKKDRDSSYEVFGNDNKDILKELSITKLKIEADVDKTVCCLTTINPLIDLIVDEFHFELDFEVFLNRCSVVELEKYRDIILEKLSET